MSALVRTSSTMGGMIFMITLPTRQQLTPPGPIPRVRRFTTQFCLPCSHQILEKLKTKQPIVKAEICRCWDLEDNFDLPLEAQVVTRRRPRGSRPLRPAGGRLAASPVAKLRVARTHCRHREVRDYLFIL